MPTFKKLASVFEKDVRTRWYSLHKPCKPRPGLRPADQAEEKNITEIKDIFK
jgi:hypothetical protein